MNCNPIEDDWPWEVDESKRYPPKDPALLTDFEKRYPVDPIGQEAGDNARVWRIYQDRMNEMDEDTISAWNDSINFLLIFTGLFSAVLTAFVIESSKQLERDPSETVIDLLVVLVSHFNGSGIPSRSEFSLNHFVAPASARVTNAFWFLSLSLALVVSMLAILAKQWITTFSSRMRAPVANFRMWAHRHRVFRDGFDRWHLNAFISSLSVALHGAVLLFLAGLIVHLFTRDPIIFGLVLTVTVLAVGVYVAATVAPLFDGTCPTATPLLIHARLVCLAIFSAGRRPFCGSGRDCESGNQRPLKGLPPFDPDVVLSEDRSPKRDTAILTLMFSELPAGHDVDAVTDALGALEPTQYDFGEDLKRMRIHVRERLGEIASTAGITISDAATVSRALRSLIFIESRSEYLGWEGLETLIAYLKPIRTHDMFALLTALQFQLQRQQEKPLEQLELMEQDNMERHRKRHAALKREEHRILQEQRQLEQRLGQEQQPRNQSEELRSLRLRQKHLRISCRVQEQAILEREERCRLRRLEQQLKPLRNAFSVSTAIARWRLCAPSGAQHPVSPRTLEHLFKEIDRTISGQGPKPPLDLEFCAILVIGFGGDINFRQRCNELVTPLAISALDQERNRRDSNQRWPAWQPSLDSPDWRLRALDFWAYIQSNLCILKLSTPFINEVYAYILTAWRDEEWLFLPPTATRLRGIVLPADQLNLPAAARTNLWRIASPTLTRLGPSPVQAGIIYDIFHGASWDEMVATNPTIIDSVINFVRGQRRMRSHSLEVSYQYFADMHRHLLALMQPDVSAATSEPRSTWQILHPYLIASPNDKGIADLVVSTSVILSIHAGMNGNAATLFEQLLRGGIGRRVVLSHENRSDALLVAKNAHIFATTWWEEMRNELLQISSIWVPTAEFGDAASFVRKVEDGDDYFDYPQMGCAWLPQFDEERYHDAWIQYIGPGYQTAEGFER